MPWFVVVYRGPPIIVASGMPSYPTTFEQLPSTNRLVPPVEMLHARFRDSASRQRRPIPIAGLGMTQTPHSVPGPDKGLRFQLKFLTLLTLSVTFPIEVPLRQFAPTTAAYLLFGGRYSPGERSEFVSNPMRAICPIDSSGSRLVQQNYANPTFRRARQPRRF